jgi:hypothetical protein
MPVPSSPVRSVEDSVEVLERFFEWYITRYAAKQGDVLKKICEKLVAEDWSIDTLRAPERGGSMTMAIWESYGFRLGTLAKLQARISLFKRGMMGGASGGDNTSEEEP